MSRQRASRVKEMRSRWPTFTEFRSCLWPAIKRISSDQMTDVAAALTYYAVFSIFPAMIALISTLSLIGHGATDPILESLADAPGPVSEILSGVVESASNRTAGPAFVLGLGVAIWGASGYVGAFARASNRIFDVEDHRSFWKSRPLQLGLTALLLLLVVVAATASVLTGPIAREAGDMIGLGAEAARTWDRAKVPGVLLTAALLITLLMRAAPAARFDGMRAVLPGALLTLALWVTSSLALGVYFAKFAAYDETYGALAGAVAFLFWLWVSNLAALLGQLVNSELRLATARDE